MQRIRYLIKNIESIRVLAACAAFFYAQHLA